MSWSLPSRRCHCQRRWNFEQGACLGIPGITAHRAVHIAGPVDGRIVLVQGGAGAVGLCAVALAKQASARVIATVRSDRNERLVERAGADDVVRTDGFAIDEVVECIRTIAPDGLHHIVEVAFHANIVIDTELLVQGGSIATYATGHPSPPIPFWPLIFKNVQLFFLGSDDFPLEAKTTAAAALNEALAGGWPGFEIAERFPLSSIALAHDFVENRPRGGRAVITA